MRLLRRLILPSLLFAHLWTPVAFCVPDQTMTVAPAPTSGTTITAADENSRNNSIATPYNAHTHNDIASTTANTFTVGNGLAGSKSFAISNDASTAPSIRYNQAVNTPWQFTNNSSTFLNMIGTTAAFTTNAMLYAGGTATVSQTAAPTNGQLLIGSTGVAPVLSTLTAGSNITVTNAAGAITIAATGTTDISARAFNSAAISLTSGADVVLTLDSERWDTDTIHSTVSNTSRLTATTAGKYQITGDVEFAGNATGQRYIYIRLNGATVLATTRLVAGGSTTLVLNVTTHYNLAANDYVELIASQDSGGALNANSSANYSPEFEMVKVP